MIPLTGTMPFLSKPPLTLGQMGSLTPLLQGALNATSVALPEGLDAYQSALGADDEAGAQESLRQILQADGDSLRQHFFAPRQSKTLQSLALHLRNNLDDLDSSLNLLLGHGILSHDVAAILRDRLSESSNGKTKVFLLQLGRIFSDPTFENFSAVKIGGEGTEDILVRQYCNRENWEIITSFGWPMIVTEAEALLSRLLNATGFMEENEGGVAPALIATLPVDTLSPPPIEQAGDLMILGSRGMVRQEFSVISYPLLRRVLFSRMAREQFEEAAALLLTLSDPLILSRLFADLRTSGNPKWGIPNGKTFFAIAFDYLGLTLGAMSPVETAGLVAVLAERGRREKSGEALTRQLAMAFGSIHPSDLERIPSTIEPLPFLSILIGTLLETKETRRFAEEMNRIGLDPEHPAHRSFDAALQHLDFRSETGSAPEKRGLLESLLKKRTTPLLFDPPAMTLAKRQEIIARLQHRLNEALNQDSISEKNLSLLSDQILLTLTPGDVWQLVAGDASKVAKLLRQQPSDVIVAFFKGWGSTHSDAEDFPRMGSVLVALWRSNGEKGRITTREAIRLALEDRAATTVLQRALSLHGTDGDLMTEQMEMYVELADTDHLGGAINPYDFFVVSGVLKPEDLEGREKIRAIDHTLYTLKNIDKYGRIGMELRFVGNPIDGGPEDFIIYPNSGLYLEEEEQREWRAKAVDMLLRLKANGREVTDYLLAALPTGEILKKKRLKNNLEVYSRLIMTLEQGMTEREILYFEALDKIAPQRLTDKYLLPLFKKGKGDPHTKLEGIVKMFGFQHQSVQQLLLKFLRKEENFYKNYRDPNNRSDETEVDATPAVRVLIGQGDAGLDLLYDYLAENYNTWIRLFLYVAERVGTPHARKRVAMIYGTPEWQNAVIFSLIKMDNETTPKNPDTLDPYWNYLFQNSDETDLNLLLLVLHNLEKNLGLSAIEEKTAKSELLSRFFAAAREEGTEAMHGLVVTGSHLESSSDHRKTDWSLIPSFHPQLSAVVALLVTLKGTKRYGEDAVRTLFKLYHATHKHAGLQRFVLPQKLSEYLRVALNRVKEENAEQFANPADLEFFRLQKF